MDKDSLPFVDLHVHTWYSDSALSPEMVARGAYENRVGLLAVADHELFEGTIEIRPFCRSLGIELIPAVEMEGTFRNVQYHILCYGANENDAILRARARKSRRILDEMSEQLIVALQGKYPWLSLDDFASFTYDRLLGGWKGLHYLLARGVTSALREGMKLYAQYGITYQNAGFPMLDELLNIIHNAGGVAVLAHPGIMISQEDERAFRDTLNAVLDQGIDGVECFYPAHSPDATAWAMSVCRARNLLITSGSDCHGAFGRTRIGQMDVTRDMLRLDGLPIL